MGQRMNVKQRMGLFGVPAMVIAIVVMLVVPMPTFLLDILITLNLSAALVVMLTTMHVRRARDFSVFPSMLLVATMFRLALNVSVTRLVLLHGYAGTVVQAFGSFVVGGQIVVGIVIFMILIVIQFVVVTSGAGRVSEVAARFSLDAMAPKLVAIDGELNSGLIDEMEARRRRKEIDETSEFYGNMDGASKFVRGDAIAALVITFINLLGGFAIGVLQNHDTVGAAIHTYSILSIGDGLVSQIPALLLSISTGLIVTRGATDEDDFGSDVTHQFGNQPRAIQVAGMAMVLLALIPGLPHIPFLLVGAVLIYLSSRIRKSVAADKAKTESEAAQVQAPTDTPQALAAEIRVEPLQLEIAPNLAPLADRGQGGDLLDRIRGLRRKLAYDKGILIPKVHTRDNIELPPSTYAIRVHGVEVARGQAPPGRMLAIGPGLESLPGDATIEPVFGLPAKWIPGEARQEALAAAGITAIDRSSAIITHLGEVASAHAGELLSMQQVRILVDVCKGTDPVAVEEMTAAQVGVTDLHRVLVGLLEEGVPILDLVRIVEAVTERGRVSKETEGMIEAARQALGPSITVLHAKDRKLAVITLDTAFEQSLVNGLRHADGASVLAVDGLVLEHLVAETRAAFEQAGRTGQEPVLAVAAALRPALHRLLAAAVPRLAVMSVNEISSHVQIERSGVVSGANAAIGV
ncbi:MAG: flagellar biosynthesis protein FlhA [Acidimicrobiales bacterium]